MKATTKEIPSTDFGHLNENLKRSPQLDAAIRAKMEVAQKTLNKAKRTISSK